MATTKKDKTDAVTEPVKREDPLVKAQREYQEKIERIKANAEKLLANAREELEASERNVAKAVKVRDERKARVEALEAQASASMTHGSNSYAVALGAESVDPVED